MMLKRMFFSLILIAGLFGGSLHAMSEFCDDFYNVNMAYPAERERGGTVEDIMHGNHESEEKENSKSEEIENSIEQNAEPSAENIACSNNESKEEESDEDGCDRIEKEEERLIQEAALREAPPSIHAIIKRFKNPLKYKKHLIKKFLLVGPPGTGKTTIAKAIANVCESDCRIEHTPDLLSKYSNETVENIKYLFEEILRTVKKRQRFILVLDEINSITDKRKGKNSDSVDCAREFWTKLDQLDSNPYFLVIGTTNDETNMSKALKSRFLAGRILITLPSVEVRKRTFEFYLSLDNNAMRAADIDQDYLSEFAQRLNNFSVRDIKDLVALASHIHDEQNPLSDNIVFTKSNLEAALQRFEINIKAFEYDKPEESEAVRLHKDNKEFQQKLHDEGIENQNKKHQEGIDHQNRLHRETQNKLDRNRREDLEKQERHHEENKRAAHASVNYQMQRDASQGATNFANWLIGDK